MYIGATPTYISGTTVCTTARTVIATDSYVWAGCEVILHKKQNTHDTQIVFLFVLFHLLQGNANTDSIIRYSTSGGSKEDVDARGP